MKKVLFIFFLVIIYIVIITEKLEPSFVEKIDLNLKENEVGITFISLTDSKSLLINRGNRKILVILEYLNSHKINNALKLFGAESLDYIVMNNNYSVDITAKNNIIIGNKEIELYDIDFSIKNDVLKIEYQDHDLCIYQKENPRKLTENCHYIYFLKVDKNLNINDSVNMIFYDEDTNPDYLESIFDKWIDIYMIKKNYYVTLKLDEDTYDTITLPIYK
jgi:hypothetical protein